VELLFALACAQLTSDDYLFARLAARSLQMPYEQSGVDPAPIRALLAEADAAALADPVKAYRANVRAIAVMSGTPWSPDAELATALDFSIDAKIVGPGDVLRARATFLFDAPAAANGPYRLHLELLPNDKESAAPVDPAITLGDIRGRRSGETLGLNFVPSKLVGPGLHVLRATLRDGAGAELHRYVRTFFIVKDLNKRMSALEKSLELAPEVKGLAPTTARYLMESIQRARREYLGGAYQNLTGFLHTRYRSMGFAASELMDFDAALERAAALAAALGEGRDLLSNATGDLHLAYRSAFDGKLVPFRLYVPTTYDASKAYPLIVLLHGAGGDENVFFDKYARQWVKTAEERGVILASVNGRGPVSGYLKDNGAEQDVLDVTALVRKIRRVDHSRVYLAGHSMGAGGTWRIGLEQRETFAALAPIAGTRPSPALERALGEGRKIPLIIVAGAKDALVPVAGCRQVAEKARAAGFPTKYVEYADGDHINVGTLSVGEIFDWFEAHPLNP
jgi:predicted esterase